MLIKKVLRIYLVANLLFEVFFFYNKGPIEHEGNSQTMASLACKMLEGENETSIHRSFTVDKYII